jgi:hypothetical protein
MFITYIQLANASLNVSSDALSARSPSTFARSASASSASSASAGSRNPRPCGASGCAPERDSAKSEPCETRRSGVRCGVGPGMVRRAEYCAEVGVVVVSDLSDRDDQNC